MKKLKSAKGIVVMISFLFLISNSNNLIAQTFTGTKIIGATPSDYPTIRSAVNALKTGIVTGPVIFKIKPGTYTEKNSIPLISGTSKVNTITFTSESGNAEDVIITSVAGTNDTNGYVFQLNGTANLILSKLTIRNTGLTFASGVQLIQEASDNSIIDCIIKVDSTQKNASAKVYGIFAGGSIQGINNANFSNFIGNTIIGGNEGIRLGTSTALGYLRDRSNTLINNKISAFYNAGISALSNDTVIIKNNTLVSSKSRRDGTQFGIKIESCDGDFLVSGNYMCNIAGNGMRFHNVVGKNAALVFNNILSGGGIHITNGRNTDTYKTDKLHLYHNSVYFDKVAVGSEGPYALQVEGGPPNQNAPTEARQIVIKNNIFYSPNGAKSRRYYGPINQAPQSNYNNFFTTGPELGPWSIEGPNSISMDPFFVSELDLHVLNKDMDNLGTPISFVKKDYDGENRSIASPDIGADEYGPRLVDLVMVSVAPPTFKLGDNQISFTVKSNGNISLKDSLVSFSYSKNGGTTWSTSQQFQLSGLTGFNAFQTLSFSIPLQITTAGTYQLCVRVNPPGLRTDADQRNEQICLTVCTGSPGGVFTIGGSVPDFPTINAALASIPICGIAGPIVFNIRPGIYSEKIYLKEIIGASNNNSITLQSETGKPEDVLITSSDSRATVNFVSAKHFTLRNLTLENKNTNFWASYTVQFKTNNKRPNDYNSIEGCRILIDSVGSYPSSSIPFRVALAIVDSTGSGSTYEPSVAHHTTITNNYIAGGRQGIVFRGRSSSNYDKGNAIINNIISQSDDQGMDISNQDSILIKDNIIRMRDNTDGTGIDINNTSNFNINANYLTNVGNCGISINNGLGNSLIANNMIAGGFKASPNSIGQRGISLTSCKATKILFNSVYVDNATGASSSFLPSAAFLIRNSPNGNNVVKNNIFYHAAESYAYYTDNVTSISESDYNDIFTSGSKYAYWNGDKVDMAELRASSGMEGNSMAINPKFFSNSDLHTSNSQFRGKGFFISDVPKDFDGELRPISAPMIGADEFLPVNLEVSDVSPKVAAMGNNAVSIMLINKGYQSLVDSTISLSFSTDGGLVWTAPEQFQINALNEFNNTETFVFSNQWNISSSGSYTLCGRINPPGLSSDLTHEKESICTDVCLGNAGGTFTIGGTSPDFPTLSAASAFLTSTCGIAGPILFNIRKGTYTENFSLTKINGSSALNTITFQAESGILGDVKIQNVLGSNKTLVLNGSNYTIFNKLNFINNSTKGSAVLINSGATNNIFESCLIQVDSTSARDSLFGIEIYNVNPISTLINKNTTIKNCAISGGASNVMAKGSSASSFYDDGLVLEGNKLRNAFYDAVHVQNNKNVSVHSNSVNLNISNTYANGIFVDKTTGDLNISNNTIIRAGNSGITIFNAQLNSGLISNNMIGGLFKNSGVAYGIDIEDSKKIKVIHNSTNLDVETSFSAAFAGRSNKDIEVFNNIFFNKGRGYSYVIEEADASNVFDYNDHFSNGDVLASYNETIVSNLAELKTTSSQEQNSVSVNPDYLATTNLHTFKKDLEGKGKYFSIVPKDIDQTLRDSLTPDIGADEFIFGDDAGVNKITSPINNLEITEGDSVEVIVELKNFGTSNLGAFDVNIKVNNTEIKKLNYTSGLAVGSSNTFNLGYFKPSDTGTYTLCSKTFVNNDVAPSNDEKCITIKVKKKAPPTVKDGYLMSIEEPKDTLTKKYGEEKEIRVKIKNVGNILLDNFELSYTVNGGAKKSETYAKTLNVNQEDVYTFTKKWTILDSGKTTICAKINVTGDNNTLNNEICKEVKVSYPIKIGIENKRAENEFKIYPNPASDKIIIYNSSKENTAYKIYNVLGDVVLSGILQSNENEIKIENIKDGMYYITFDSTKRNENLYKKTEQKFIKLSR